ncbi:hypothetical protein CDAR_578801 [Caerostris darwini]|uniref:Uncharacterized protein n=1 Tax=Caerostris darwini TaxID=1538125 RepID=A0AAV4UBZ2_9ARAC|nr:hypothetical protein CDAR_578801 [Caerostris darwini]
MISIWTMLSPERKPGEMVLDKSFTLQTQPRWITTVPLLWHSFSDNHSRARLHRSEEIETVLRLIQKRLLYERIRATCRLFYDSRGLPGILLELEIPVRAAVDYDLPLLWHSFSDNHSRARLHRSEEIETVLRLIQKRLLYERIRATCRLFYGSRGLPGILLELEIPVRGPGNMISIWTMSSPERKPGEMVLGE